MSHLPISISKAFSPGHITGFFTIEKIPNIVDSYSYGSLGVGFNICKGVTTTVKIYPSSSKNYEIIINGTSSFDAKVSKYVVESYLKIIKDTIFVSIEHKSEIPIGYGLGSSGAAALGLSYALNDSLNLGFSKSEAGMIAHNADIYCKTGLGTVVSEYTGGFEFRKKIGGPGIGEVIKIPVSNDYCAIILCLSPISTSSLLGEGALENRQSLINIYGKKLIDTFSEYMTIDKFLEFSFDFASKYGLSNGICKEPLLLLQSMGIKSSVALFGHTVFTIVKKDKLLSVKKCLQKFNGLVLCSSIDDQGARLLKGK